ncbi:hypothetical protein XEUV354_08925 [Xanthomonas euvesicatoria]|nr:hypothetical protein XEUV683_17860 [Xanthomonas euvesicatoria]KLA59000.1 hypothetical protein XEUV684_12740 [Xanthomonas euvesicatoria]KLA60000.1 hypothetical protein XEUV685_01740 [Xanthomonas euvesicatoria]KLA63233.1 hypothetical protein XEUV689_20125 [Xanthomonas euvesicatoria]KLA66246.1 hypothetical protein XEUV695_13525 [Xanthomonas euvesicatoria]
MTRSSHRCVDPLRLRLSQLTHALVVSKTVFRYLVSSLCEVLIGGFIGILQSAKFFFKGICLCIRVDMWKPGSGRKLEE